MNALSETRAADREVMARTIAAQAVALGAEASIHPDPERRRIAVSIIAPGGLAVSVEFRARGPHPIPDTYVLPWHIVLDSDATLAEAFAPGHVNPHHRQKATLVAYGFDALTRELARALRMAADGSAFEPTFDRTGATS